MGRPSKYPAEFREQAVDLARACGKTIAEVAGATCSSTTRRWATRSRQTEQSECAGRQRATAADRRRAGQLTRLRRENAKLKTERKILKKAAAFLVTEPTR